MWNELGISASDLDRVLRRSRDEVFALATIGKPPVGIMLGGQPASGKSLLIRRLRRQNPAIGFVVINGDEFRPLHPRFAEFNQLSELEAATLIQPFVNYIGQTLLAEALKNRFNILIEGTMHLTHYHISPESRPLLQNLGSILRINDLQINFITAWWNRFWYERSGETGRIADP